MSRRRSRLEIILTFLSVIRGGKEKPTHIMYAINLSWTPTQKMLSSLVDHGLIDLRTSSGVSNRRYTITEKGVKVLDYFKKAKEILPEGVYLNLATTS